MEFLCGRMEFNGSYLEHTGMQFSPDLIIVAYVLNDAGYEVGLDIWESFINQYENIYLRWSYFISFVHGRIAQKLYANP